MTLYKALFYILFLLVLSFTAGCSFLEKRDMLKELGVKLGSTSPQVQSRMGEPKVDFSFSTAEHNISVWVYDAQKTDYQPGYEGDDYGAFPINPGFREYNEDQYRLIFVDGYLCSIEDFVNNKVYTIDRNELPDNIPAILDEIHER